MTVFELIDFLQTLPRDFQVYVNDGGQLYELHKEDISLDDDDHEAFVVIG